MTELERVIRALECCTAEIPLDNNIHKEDFCKNCPYHDSRFTYCFVKNDLMRDALFLLKAQEPEKPIYKQIVNEYERYTEYINRSICAKCGAEFIHRVNYCPCCGKAVKWE